MSLRNRVLAVSLLGSLLLNVLAVNVADIYSKLPVSNGRWPVVDSGVTGNVPRGPTLPGAFGLDATRSETSWKYFAAILKAQSGTYYDLFAAAVRQFNPTVPTGSLAICMFRLGSNVSGPKMTINAGFGFSQNPGDPFSSIVSPVNTDYYSQLKVQNCGALNSPQYGPLARKRIDMQLLYQLPVGRNGTRGAPVGSIGAEYLYTIYDDTSNTTVTLKLRDTRGTVYEGSSGNVATPMDELSANGRGIGSIEYASPGLEVISGSIISATSNVKLVGGNLFIDHQEVARDPQEMTVPGSPLYTGVWFEFTHKDGRNFIGVTFFPAGSPLESGTKTKVKPTRSFAQINHPVTDTQQGFKSNGMTRLFGDQDFAFNVFNVKRLDPSKVYVSSFTGKRYATQFELELYPGKKGNDDDDDDDDCKGKREKFYMEYFHPNNEIYSTIDPNGAFAEGGVTVYSDKAMKKVVGYGFVEQMGRTAL